MSIFYFNPLFCVYFLVLVFVCGACMGSFVNCVQLRLSQKSGSLVARSVCPKCGHKLGFFDLIPVLSWIFLRGKCRYCREPVDFRYFAVEVIFGAGFVGIAAMFGWSLATLQYLILFTILMAESLCDITTLEVPDTLHILALVNYFAFLFFNYDWLERLKSGAIGFAVFGGGILLLSIIADKAYGRESLGGADIKIIAVLGLYFGPVKMLFMIIVSCIFGLIGAILVKAGFAKIFPFIPAITLGAYITALFSDPIIEWYLGLFAINHVH